MSASVYGATYSILCCHLFLITVKMFYIVVQEGESQEEEEAEAEGRGNDTPNRQALRRRKLPESATRAPPQPERPVEKRVGDLRAER